MTTAASIIRASAALAASGAYDSTPTVIACAALAGIEVCITYTRGTTGGAFKMKISVSDDGGTTFFDRTVIDGSSLSSGALNVFTEELKFPVASSGSAERRSFIIDVGQATHLAVNFAEYGATGTPGTLKATATKRS